MKLAKIISLLLGPTFVLFPIPYILVSKFTNDHIYSLKWAIFSYAFIIAVVVFVALGVFFRVFTNFDVSKREQRPLLFAFSAFAIFCYFVSLVVLSAPKILFFGVFSLVLSLISIVIVTRWSKASIHMAVLVSVIILISAAYRGYFFLFFMLIPLLAWSRIKMKEHTLKETIIGGLLGAIMTLSIYIIAKYFLLEMIYN